MNVLVVGGGGREHALIQALRKNPAIENLYALPGNGGIEALAQCAPVKPTDISGITAFAIEKKVDFAVVTPDDPLVLGAVDALNEAGIAAFGPTKSAARIEGSKSFAKDLMRKYGIPTAGYRVFDVEGEALSYLQSLKEFPVVVKADGLALGKGVAIAATVDEAQAAVRAMMSGGAFGKSGERVVIEEYLTGPEVSVLAFTDGRTLKPMVSSMDHKRAYDGDKGPNTGGMGTIAPNPYYTEEIAAICMERVFLPTIRAMEAEGCRFRGCLYFGLMLTAKGPYVIEYNCRFGDPEAQVVLPLLKSDLLTVMHAVSQDRLHETPVENQPGAAACVVLASGGYPLGYKTGERISFAQESAAPGIDLFHAGTRRCPSGAVFTAGGRVLNVVATADTLGEAIKKAYRAVSGVRFEGMQYRKDIGQSALGVLRR